MQIQKIEKIKKVLTLCKNEKFLIYSIFVLSTITIIITWYSHILENNIVDLKSHVFQKNVYAVQYEAKYSLMNVLNPLVKAGLLINSKPESEPRLAYKIYLLFIEKKFDSDEKYWTEVNSIETIQDFLDKIDQSTITETVRKTNETRDKIDVLSKRNNLFFFIIVLIQIINTWMAYCLGVLNKNSYTINSQK